MRNNTYIVSSYLPRYLGKFMGYAKHASKQVGLISKCQVRKRHMHETRYKNYCEHLDFIDGLIPDAGAHVCEIR